MPETVYLPASQEKLLLALAKFRYLTTKQMLEVGVSTNQSYLNNKILRPLYQTNKPLIESHDFGVIPGKGRLSRVYCLTKAGVETLADSKGMEGIKYPIGGVQYKTDYFHRIAYIDFCIAFQKWTDSTDSSVLDWLHYFDKIGSNRQGEPAFSETRLAVPGGHMIPDGLLFFASQGKRRAVAVEIHNVPQVAQITKQLQGHFPALDDNIVSDKFGHDKGSIVFSVFDDSVAMERVKSRMLDTPNFSDYMIHFYFSSLEQVKKDFGKCWSLADGTKKNIS